MSIGNPELGNVKVSVAMITYNHEAFVAQAIESVLMQRTDFDYELILGEDYSTDGTRAIVQAYGERYPDRIRLLLSERNQGASALSAAVLDACRGQYIAGLEGDDYWSDPEKLQRQVDFLQNHPDCSACFHPAKFIYDDDLPRGQDSKGAPDSRLFFGLDDLLIYNNFIPTCSLLFRRDIILNTPNWFSPLLFEDWALNLLCASRGKIGYIDQHMGVYRVHSGGLWTTMSDSDRILNVVAVLKAAAANLNLAHNIHLRRLLLEQYRLLASVPPQAGNHAGMPPSSPRVSVVIPCYEQGNYLSEAVESVIRQTFSDWECLIVNDGSPDNTEYVARALIARYPDKRIRLVEKQNGGLADARNYGISQSLGAYVLPLDADDKIEPFLLEKAVALLEANADVAVAYTDMQTFGSGDAGVWPGGEFTPEKLAADNQLPYCALYRREIWEACVGYDLNLMWGYEDWDFWISCASKGFTGMRIPEPLFCHRARENSMYSQALQHDAELRAQIVINHPDLYNADKRRWAEEVIGLASARD